MKKFFICTIALALSAISLTSCFTAALTAVALSQDKKVAIDTSAWIGKNRHAIMLAFGVPEREVSDGADGTVLVYEDISRQRKATTQENTHFGMFDTDYETSVSTTSLRKYAEFFMSSTDTCYLIRTNLRQWQFDHPNKRPWE